MHSTPLHSLTKGVEVLWMMLRCTQTPPPFLRFLLGLKIYLLFKYPHTQFIFNFNRKTRVADFVRKKCGIIWEFFPKGI